MAKDKKNVSVEESAEVQNVSPEKKTKSKDVEKKPNVFSRIWKKLVKFCKDTVGELKKVVWTSKTEVWKSFQLVIATVVSVSVAIAVIDFVSSLVINAIAGLIG